MQFTFMRSKTQREYGQPLCIGRPEQVQARRFLKLCSGLLHMLLLSLGDDLIAHLFGDTDRHGAADGFDNARCAAFLPMLGFRMPLMPVRRDVTHRAAADLGRYSVVEQMAFDCQYATAPGAADKFMRREKNHIKRSVLSIHVDGQIGRPGGVVPDSECPV